MTLKKIGRNEQCQCGSGKKYKHCCQEKSINTPTTTVETVTASTMKLFALALQHHQAGQLAQAESLYRQILHSHPNDANALHLLGVALHQAGKKQGVAELISRAIKIRPDFSMYNNLANILKDQQQLDSAILNYHQAITLKPDYAEAYNNLGAALREQSDLQAAQRNYEKAIALKPDYAEAYNNLAIVLNEQNKFDLAVANYQKAIALKPNHADFYNNLAASLKKQQKLEAAVANYQRAIALKPDYAEAHSNLGHIFRKQKKFTEAIFHYQKALEIKPEYTEALGSLFYARQYCCDWTNYLASKEKIIQTIQQGQEGYKPLSFLAVSDSAQAQLQCATIFARKNYPLLAQFKPKLSASHQKLRVAYISADFREHALSILMVELFELHNRNSFEVIAIALQHDESSLTSLGRRVKQAFDQFIDVSAKSDQEVALLMAELEIDIAVDLMGFTAHSRTAIFSYRPAPVQINYLGYPGTMGASYIDYILADAYLIPTRYQAYYSEKVVYLPDCFQVNDSKRFVPQHIPSRAEFGLPEVGLVFCSFNNSYKFTPIFFALWMRLLKKIPDSVLWLFADNDLVEAHLRHVAMQQGVAPGRLIFAKKVSYQQYLAQYPLADLFLDSLPFNAGTTASDALWMGLPVLTCSGEAFAARMAGSLLNALELSELITDNLADYEAKAIELATNPELLRQVRQKMAENRSTCPLFNAQRFCRHLESAYLTLWEKYQRGETAESFSVIPQLL